MGADGLDARPTPGVGSWPTLPEPLPTPVPDSHCHLDIAYDEQRDAALVAIDARHLFASNMTRLAVRRGSFLRGYVYAFISAFASPLTREVVDRAMGEEAGAGFDI